MRKLLKKIILFALILISVVFAIHTITNIGLRKSEFGNLKEWREIINGEINSDLIIQGSSRAWVQYNTYIIDSALNTKSYNFGIDGSPFNIQYIRFKAFLNNNKCPKYIIQNVDIDLFDFNNEIFQKYQFLPFLNNNEYRKLLFDEEIITKTDYYIPFSVYMGQPKAIQVGFEEALGIYHYKSQKYHGYKANPNTWNGQDFESVMKSKKIVWRQDYRALKIFDEYISLCKKNNIKLVLVYAPLYKPYINRIVNFEKSRTMFSNIAKNNNLIYLDYISNPMCNSKNNFYNATHLNAKGSYIFTNLLVKDLSKLLR